MGTPANIIIQDKSIQPTHEIDKVLIFVRGDGYFYGSSGVINTITRAYNNKGLIVDTNFFWQEEDLQMDLNYVRNDIGFSASSIIHASSGYYLPVSTAGYREYDEKGWFYDYAYQYIIEIINEFDHEGDIIWEITLSGLKHIANFNSITRMAKEWEKFNITCIALQSLVASVGSENYDYDQKDVGKDIAKSIHFKEIDQVILEDIYKNVGCCPCDICPVRATCVNVVRNNRNQRRRRIMEKCSGKMEYEDNNIKYLIKRFGNDNMLKELLLNAAEQQKN